MFVSVKKKTDIWIKESYFPVAVDIKYQMIAWNQKKAREWVSEH